MESPCKNCLVRGMCVKPCEEFRYYVEHTLRSYDILDLSRHFYYEVCKTMREHKKRTAVKYKITMEEDDDFSYPALFHFNNGVIVDIELDFSRRIYD